MNSIDIQVIKKRSILIFVVLVAFGVVLLGAVTIGVYFTGDGESNNYSSSNNSSSSNKSKQEMTNVMNNIKNKPPPKKKENNANSLMKNIKVNKARDSGLLSNVKDGSYKNFDNKQVFNISNNIFTYDDAKAVCKAHGAELATYEQVMDAYKSGAEWCNYGWSDKKMALYPTQKATWEKLQEDPENSNMCGEWGVNGGYFENTDTLFGANCYGIKPEPKDRERLGPPPISQSEQNILAKVARFKEEKGDFTLNPFNKDQWSQKK